MGLVIKNGRIDHDEYGHDDQVVSWLLAHWFISHGKNLDAYDLDGLMLSSEVETREIKTFEDFQQHQEEQEQLAIRRKMVELYKELEETQDHYVSLKIEQELRSLCSRLILKDTEVFSIEQLILLAKEKKKKQKPNSYFPSIRTQY